MTMSVKLDLKAVSTAHDDPRYEHDCVDCVFVGRYYDYDLYVHWDEDQKTVIGRTGDNPSSYVSGLACATEVQLWLKLSGEG
jgi:hypothetical protein